MNEKDSARFSLGLVFLIFACAGLSAFFTWFPLTDADIFWHLAAGREMISTGHFLRIDPFSFTLASAQWTDLHWLFQLLVYGIYKVGDYKALLFFKLTVVGLVAFLLCRIFPSKRYALITSALTPLVFFWVRYLIDVRPLLITILCMTLYVLLFEHARRTGKNRPLWWCVPLQILWTNSQGLYMIGLFIIGAYWLEGVFEHRRSSIARSLYNAFPLKAFHSFVTSLSVFPFPQPGPCQGPGCGNGKTERDGKTQSRMGEAFSADTRPITLSMVLIGSMLSCIVNPYGLSGIVLPFKLFGRITPVSNNIYSMNISENIPLFFLTGHETIYKTTVLCLAVVAGVLLWANRKKVRIAHLVLFCGFLPLASNAMRNVVLFVIIAIPIIGYNLTYGNSLGFDKNIPQKMKFLAYGAAIFAACSALFFAVYCHAMILSTFPQHRTISPFRFPEIIVEHLKREPVTGEIFNDIRYGGYLIWRLYPEKKVFIDTRLVIRSPRFFAEYLMLCDDPSLFPQVAKKFNVTQVVLTSAIFPTYLKLIKWLYHSDEWYLQYTDGASVLFEKNSVSAGPRVDLSDTNSLKAVADDINSQWGHSEFVRREAFGYFIDLVKYLELPGAADFIRNQAHLKGFL